MRWRVRSLWLLVTFFAVLVVLPFEGVWAVDAVGSSWSKLASMPTSRGGLGLAVVSDRVYALGGLNDEGDLAVNEMYDIESNKWSVRESMPTARSGFAVGVYGNKIYVVGGLAGDSFLGTMEVYDPVGDSWQSLSSMPTPRADLAACVVGDKMYLVGGKFFLSVAPFVGQCDVVEVYDFKTDKWSTEMSMPVSLQGYSSVVLGSKIYIIGGSRQSVLGVDMSSNVVQIFDTQSGKWSTGEALPFTSSYGGAVVTSGFMAPVKIYYVGGFSDGMFSDRVEIFDVEDNVWVEEAKMLTARSYFGLVNVDDLVYAIGGFDGENWLSSNERLNPVDYGKVPPVVELLSPENRAYKNIQINYKVNRVVSWVGFSLDGAENTTLRGAPQLTNLSEGEHSIVLFANDTLGNMGASQVVYFTIDNAAPIITILMPLEQQTYDTANVVLSFITDKPVSYLAYSLNGQPEVEIAGNVTLPTLPNGRYNVKIYAIDELGNAGVSEEVLFTISTFPIFWFTAIILLGIIIISLGYLLVNRVKSGSKSNEVIDNILL